MEIITRRKNGNTYIADLNKLNIAERADCRFYKIDMHILLN